MPIVKPAHMREVVRWSDNRYEGTEVVNLAGLHESVGATDAMALALFCERAGVSYNAVCDDDTLIYTVPRSDSAWHIRRGNGRVDGLCLCTPVAGYSRREWLEQHRGMLDIAAWWLAVVCVDRGIDIARCSHRDIADALRGDRAAGGVIGHVDYTYASHLWLGYQDGAHIDPRNLPYDYVIDRAARLARGEATAPAEPTTTGRGTVIPIALDPTATPEDWDDSTTWQPREVVINLGYIGGWRGKLWLRLSAMHPGGRLFRAHVDYPEGDRVRFAGWPGAGGDDEWPGIHLEPPYRAKAQYAFAPPAGPGTLMLTYAAPAGASLNLEWEH